MAVDIPQLDDNKPIAYISSPLINVGASESSSNDYFVQLLTLIVRKIQAVIGSDVVVKLAKSTSSEDQINLIKETFAIKEKYSGVILSPVNTSHAWLELKTHIKNIHDYKSLPIITIDKQISNDVNGVVIPSITSDWMSGGSCAGDLILRYLEKIGDTNAKNVLYMPGLEGSEERILGLTEALKKDTRFTLTRLPHADFTREDAKARFTEYLSTNRNIVDFIFACNDEMALGIRDAILEALPSEFINSTRVIGFDGTKEFVSVMDSASDEILLATVDVNLENQVDKLVERIRPLFSTSKSYTNLEYFSHHEAYSPKISQHFAKIISNA
jgi:ABC-type sugar transport system substrate-binding protein